MLLVTCMPRPGAALVPAKRHRGDRGRAGWPSCRPVAASSLLCRRTGARPLGRAAGGL